MTFSYCMLVRGYKNGASAGLLHLEVGEKGLEFVAIAQVASISQTRHDVGMFV